ncbi:MAG: hypothetical protein Q8K78_18215 [Planctomycetaceae bacterium]|nr:hypothetical protein [Planctomycetaceae bacterium]
MISAAHRTVAEYLDAVSDSIIGRYRCPDPATVTELRALLAKYPDIGKRYIPADPLWRKELGLSRYAGKEAPPFSLEFRERFVRTLEVDPEFAAAVWAWIGGVA